MRLWTLSPSYLDAKGLVAAWREGLLALAVLSGKTRGYRGHPQLIRFRTTASPIPSLRRYLTALADEAESRGYRFDRARLEANGPAGGLPQRDTEPIPVTAGQIRYEAALLIRKLAEREPARVPSLMDDLVKGLKLNPVFTAIAGDIAEWERPKADIIATLTPLKEDLKR